MAFDTQMVKLSMLAAINPARKIKKGTDVPFVDMAALPTHGRDIQPANVSRRVAKGAGAHFRNGDTLLARITPCLENGKTAQVRCLDDGSIAEGSTEFIVLAGNDPADNDYVYYLCRNPDFRDFAIKRMEGTSGRQRVSWNAIAEYEFACPEPETRRSVAEVLSSLDDRIDLLRQTNTTLEAIAQALFKSWFVDFDPVHAKAEGRDPEAMDVATAALFPSEFETSELGPIPKGWRVERLSDLVELAYGKALKSSDRVAGEIPVYGSGGVTGWHNVALVTEPTIIVGRKGSVGTIYWEDRPCHPIDTVFFVRSQAAPLTFCLQVLRSLGLDKMNTDAAVPGLNRENAYRLEVVAAATAVNDAWHKIAGPIYDAMSNNSRHCEVLSQLRDTLLPRLISGKHAPARSHGSHHSRGEKGCGISEIY